MTYFFAKNDDKTAFYYDKINEIPDNAISITDNEHSLLLMAQYRGATLDIQNNKAVALDYQGNVIDLNHISDKTLFSRPSTLADLARDTLETVNSQAPMIIAMGGSFGPKTKSAVLMLQAIINGTDTSSTQLPVVPDDLTT